MSDLKFAIRQLFKYPGFTTVAVLSLAVGIGANTIVLSWIRGILINAIPGVDHPEELVVVCLEHRKAGLGDTLSRPDLRSLAEEPGLFAGITGSMMGTATLRVGEETAWMWVEVPTANYFEVLGVKPVLGRGFLAGDDEASPPENAVIISHHVWQRRFQGDPGVIGRVVDVNRQPATVVGVAPPEFCGTMGALRFDAWIVPALYMGHGELRERNESQGWRWLHTVARLAPGVSLARAKAGARTVASRLTEDYAKYYRDMTFAVLPTWRSPWGGQGKFLPLLQALGTAALLLLALVTANVANLLLARGRQRESEMAVRLALGAQPRRIVRQLLIESLVLAGLGGILGVGLACYGVPLLFSLLPPTYLPISLNLGVDGWVLLITMIVTLAIGVLFGLAPALQCARTNLQQSLKEGDRTVAKASRHYLRLAFVVGEVALAMVLLIGMGLCLRSLDKSRDVSLGLDPEGVFVAGFRISPTDGDDARVNDFYRRLRQEAAAMPMVASAALADWLPLGFEGGSSTSVEVDGYQPALGESMGVDVSLVSPGYFSTLRIPLTAGRDFREGEDASQPFAIVVNQTFARRYFGDRPAIGLKVKFWNREGTVVGVAANGKYHALNEPALPWLYINQQQVTDRDQTLIVRGGGPMESLRRVVEQLADRVDPTVRPFAAMSYPDYVRAAFVVPRTAAALLTGLGLVALSLSMLGIYAVVSQQVAQRTREMAIRLALGAQPREVLRLVLRQGLKLALMGFAIGAAGGFFMSRSLRAILVDVEAGDWLTWILMTACLFTAAITACWLPARRAALIDPMVALRME